ncbi:hypothetical protein C2S51_016920 [Perilla frutescens var. frutescens]|nr:hypothetical protein C2S51_016920 [Perilla frutescens var. frutescens]
MSAFPFLSHFSIAVVSFPCHPTKVSSTSKYNFFTFSSSPNNGSNYRKVEGGIIKCNSEDSYLQSSESIPHSCSTIKAPTAPWMTEPLFVKPNEMKSMKPRTKKGLGFEKIGEHPDVNLTGKVGGGRGRLAMKKIFKSFQKLQETQDLEATSQNHENRRFKFALGDLWGNGDYGTKVDVEEKHNATEESLESDEFDIPLLESGKEAKLKKLPWEREEKMVIRRAKKEKVVTAAELSLDGMLLERFRHEAALIRKWVKVMKAGVTQAIVDQVHLIWRNDELALLKFDVPLCRNMDRAREIVELKTGGLVVWSNKDFLAVYRGHHYGSRSKNIWIRKYNSASDQGYSSANMKYQSTTTVPRVTSDGSNPDKLIHGKDGKWENLQMASLYEREADRLLDELGPRFVDWWMQKPLPVDGDLLPAVVPGFKTPFRLCPPFTSAKLTDAELTYLRKLARPLPTHFVLGRNRNHQGLAAAILKLWEKCHIAKIALKWGIPNTDNEQMANELKRLTGGVLLIRNKFLIILYRGKDFLPSEVAKVVAEREMELTQCQLREEAARVKASESFSTTHEHLICSGIVGTLSEFHRMHSEMGSLKKGKTEVDVELEAERERLEKELKDQERKLFILKKKIEKSTRVLDKLKNASRLSEEDPDLEIISKEERVCLREMGLRISSSIVLGRRGVYDGVIEGMHQHWKHREVVKVITMQKDFAQVMHTAKCVEAESGGILVAVVKLKEGHAVIVYRGKNFKRPKSAAVNLLNKREALSRSLEIQRLGSLKFFARQREQAICDLKQKLATELNSFFKLKVQLIIFLPLNCLMYGGSKCPWIIFTTFQDELSEKMGLPILYARQFGLTCRIRTGCGCGKGLPDGGPWHDGHAECAVRGCPVRKGDGLLRYPTSIPHENSEFYRFWWDGVSLSVKALLAYLDFLYFGKENISRMYTVCQAFYKLEKGDQSLTDYFMAFTKTYEELNTLLPFSKDIKVQQAHREKMALMSFLAGLPSEFETARSQILSDSKIASLEEAFRRVLQTEPPASSLTVPSAFVGHRPPSESQTHFKGFGSTSANRFDWIASAECRYCHEIGHFKNTCPKKKRHPSAHVASSVTSPVVDSAHLPPVTGHSPTATIAELDHRVFQDLSTKKIISKGRRSADLYLLDTQLPKPVACTSSATPFDVHCRLGHPSLSVLRKLCPQFSSLSSSDYVSPPTFDAPISSSSDPPLSDDRPIALRKDNKSLHLQCHHCRRKAGELRRNITIAYGKERIASDQLSEAPRKSLRGAASPSAVEA